MSFYTAKLTNWHLLCNCFYQYFYRKETVLLIAKGRWILKKFHTNVDNL